MTTLHSLVFFDFDSTIITKESFDEVIKLSLINHPHKEQLSKKIETITQKGMNGDLDFRESLLQRFSVISIKSKNFDNIGTTLLQHITPGIKELILNLQGKNIPIFLISGGFKPCLIPVGKSLNIDTNHIFANTFDIQGDIAMNVKLDNPLSESNGKGQIITAIKNTYPKYKTILIGDGANDLRAYLDQQVDIFCGFGGNIFRKKVKEKAPFYAHNIEELQLFFDSHVIQQ